MKKTIYFPHIPKCGGTSIKKFIQNSGLSAFIDYDHPPSNQKFFQDEVDRRNKEFLQLNFDVFDIVFGHYPIKRYNHNSNIVLLLRHPVDRAISHFNYWKYAIPNSNLIAFAKQPLLQQVKDGDLSFVDFLKKAKINTFFSSYLDELNPSDVKRVFFTNNMDSLFHYLIEYFELKIPIPNIRERENKLQKERISESDLEFAQTFLKEEIAIYKKFGGVV